MGRGSPNVGVPAECRIICVGTFRPCLRGNTCPRTNWVATHSPYHFPIPLHTDLTETQNETWPRQVKHQSPHRRQQ